jgi:hypothetical protein
VLASVDNVTRRSREHAKLKVTTEPVVGSRKNSIGWLGTR